MDGASHRLQAIQSTFNQTSGLKWRRILVLPDSSTVDVSVGEVGDTNHISISGNLVSKYRVLPETVSLEISSIGTPFEGKAAHIPKYPVLSILPPVDQSDSSIPVHELWGTIYGLFTLYHAQETIPILLSSSITNRLQLESYILHSGLGRKRHTREGSELFLSRAAFWQGGGTTGYHNRGWLCGSPSAHLFAFPHVQSFTRSPQVITSHPLRPPKPSLGEVLYRKYCAALGQTLEFTYFDLENRMHLDAFHKWHNDDRVNKGWGEQGTLEKHRGYVTAVHGDPAVLPVMMSWDGELMGYIEFVWIKEHHISQYIPEGARDYDRGIHVLVGEDKFRGARRSQIWLRAVIHYCFLTEVRTDRVIGEPRADNPAIIKASIAAGLHVNSIFDFPYKRSVMTLCPRDRFFKMELLSE